jgi:hypothetical protein
MHNVGGMIGGDSPLSPQGEKYAAALPALVLENVGDHPLQVSLVIQACTEPKELIQESVQYQVWTSTLQVSTKHDNLSSVGTFF